jgi:hypothetical protein
MSGKARQRGPVGETLEDFLEEQGIRDEVYEHAIKAVLAWQLGEAMKQQNLTKLGRMP